MVRFQQQKGTGESVPDGFIAQDSIKIAVETKLGDVFDSKQLKRHIEAFGSEQHKLLILLSPDLAETSRGAIKEIRKNVEQEKRQIDILHTSFENVIEKARSSLSEHDEEMLLLVADYETFCSEMNLLPRDKYTLFVPPCGRSFDENKEFRLYYCPESYGRRRAKYLGLYKQRSVRAVGEIEKVVACSINLVKRTIETLNGSPALTEQERERVIDAAQKAKENRNWDLSVGHDFYLCGTIYETDFQKSSAGGIWGRRYVDLEKILGAKPTGTVQDLALQLRSPKWE